jgi:HSP20 family molecular chaperone IbpA
MGMIPFIKIIQGGIMLTLFNSIFDEILYSGYEAASPRWERYDKGWRLKLAIPGVRKDEIGIKASQGWMKLEIPGKSLRLGMPRGGDYEKIGASLDLGILEISLPETDESGIKEIKIT